MVFMTFVSFTKVMFGFWSNFSPVPEVGQGDGATGLRMNRCAC